MDVSEVEDLLQFQSTLPVRGATAYCYVSGAEAVISIHAPRKGSDLESAVRQSPLLFQSTLPVRGATRHRKNGSTRPRFQSTLPVRGATHFVCDSHVAVQDFNPRSP